MTVLLSVVLPVILVAGVAALAQRYVKLDVRTTSRAAFYLFAPALVFDSLVRSTIGGAEFGQIAVALIIVTLVLWGFGEGLGRLLRLKGPTLSAFLLSILLINAGNLGLPIVLFAFGDAGLARASAYFTVSAAIIASLGVYLAVRGCAPGTLAIRRLAGVPLIYAAILGLALNMIHFTVPEPLAKAIHLLGQASVPVMLVTLGIQLAQTGHDKWRGIHVPALVTVIIARLIISPILALLAAWVLGLSSLARNVVVVDSAMPTAVMTTILAAEFECDNRFVTVSVLATTIISVVTLTALLNWMV
ncbi:MAG: AEC family transporter [Anaerolineae bacterium]|nr:AEC family transporter [Anaerolineae bacterium]